MPQKKICINPFKRFDIRIDGSVGCCCPPYTDNYSFGNFFELSHEEIWNGSQIQKFREAILDGSYRFCHTELCNNTDACFENADNYSGIMNCYPKVVDLSIDGHCNFKCVMCRDINNIDLESTKKMQEILESKIIPFLKNCEELYLNGSGEFFISGLCKNLIKKTSELYPNLRYTILTNGFLCTPEALKELGILDDRVTISLSLHSLKPETHCKITRVPDAFNTVLKNVFYMKECVEKREISFLLLNFVISSYNYKEIREMAHFCAENKLTGHFWEFRKWEDSDMCNNYDKYNVTNVNHPDYKEFKELLKDDIFDSEYVVLNELLEDIRNS